MKSKTNWAVVPGGKLLTATPKLYTELGDRGEELILRLDDDKDDFRHRVVESMLGDFSAGSSNVSVSPFFASEEVASNYCYPAEYEVKPICEQLVALAKHFPNLDAGPMLACSKELSQIPTGAEGPFVVPKWQKVAATYNESLEKALGMIESTRTFHNYRKGQLGPKHLRQSERTQRAEEMIANMTNGDYMLLWAQFGLRWRGRSVRKVRYNYALNEFGLGAFHSACMLLSHPDRLVKWEQLHIDCSGDEYSPGADGDFSRAPVFFFGDGEVEFYTYWVYDPDAYYGSASGFLPKSLCEKQKSVYRLRRHFFCF